MSKCRKAPRVAKVKSYINKKEMDNKKNYNEVDAKIQNKLKEIVDFADENSDKYKQENSVGSNITRSKYSVDYDRILYTKAFRRLSHKAQIYSHEKGDHYRNRMIHSLQVEQIALGIGKNLGLNLDLISAIAIGHDIGHTPFGHQGERTLNFLLNDGHEFKDLITTGKGIDFKHNLNALYLLEKVEHTYNEYGLNLSLETLDGILKHTNLCSHKKCKKSNSCLDCKGIELYRNLVEKRFDRTGVEQVFGKSYPITLEGQVVKIADEIAQREHDIDDGIREISNNIGIYKFIERFRNRLDVINKETIGCEIEPLLIKLKHRFSEECISNIVGDDFLMKHISSTIINFFIIDVTINSYNNIKKEFGSIGEVELINFSQLGDEINNYLEEEVKSEILNSFEVNRFDGKSKYIIKKLFEAYNTNPKQLPVGIYKKIEQCGEDEVMKKFNICIYISGMTDNFAKSEYNKLYMSN